jgi:hypothetical protein
VTLPGPWSCGFATLALLAVVAFIIPVFAGIFEELAEDKPQEDASLPLPTQLCVTASDAITGYWFIIMPLLAGLIFGFFQWKKTDRGKEMWDRLKLRFPFTIGDVIQKIALARWSRTFSGSVSAGVPMLQSIKLTGETAGNAVLEQAMEDLYAAAKRGGSLAGPIERNPIFPPMVGHMVAVGEETGQLENMLSKIADFYETEVDAKIKALTSLIEPLMIVFVGGVVGFIVIAMYLPIFSLWTIKDRLIDHSSRWGPSIGGEREPAAASKLREQRYGAPEMTGRNSRSRARQRAVLPRALSGKALALLEETRGSLTASIARGHGDEPPLASPLMIAHARIQPLRTSCAERFLPRWRRRRTASGAMSVDRCLRRRGARGRVGRRGMARRAHRDCGRCRRGVAEMREAHAYYRAPEPAAAARRKQPRLHRLAAVAAALAGLLAIAGLASAFVGDDSPRTASDRSADASTTGAQKGPDGKPGLSNGETKDRGGKKNAKSAGRGNGHGKLGGRDDGGQPSGGECGRPASLRKRTPQKARPRPVATSFR